MHQQTEPTEQAWTPNGFRGPPHWHRRAERWRNRGNGEPLRRDPEDRLAGGVAAGVAAWRGFSPTTVRIVPWATDPTAQVLHDCYDPQGNLIPFAPRSVPWAPPSR